MHSITFLSKVDINIRNLQAGLAPRRVRSVRNREELLRCIGDTEVLIVQNQGFGRNTVDDGVLERAGRLKLIQHHGVACDVTDVEAATRRGVRVATIPGQNSQSVAEHAFFLMMALVRRVHEGQQLLRAGRMGEIECSELKGKTLCTVGLGQIGIAIASMASGFGMDVLAVRRSRPGADPLPAGVSEAFAVADIGEAFGRSHCIVLALPLNDETHRLINRRTVAAMRPGTILVNISRGGHVDRQALEEGLAAGTMRAYAADVWWEEPPDPLDPLLSDPRVLVTPHMGGKSVEAMHRTVAALRANVERLERGEEIRNVVNSV